MKHLHSNQKEIMKDPEKTPAAYPKKSSFLPKKWWNNYLKRLNKVTKGKPPCCG